MTKYAFLDGGRVWYTVKICAIYGDETIVVVWIKCVWRVILVTNSPPTYILVLYSMNWEGGWHTTRTILSPTHSLWWCDCSEILWAAMIRVRHVKVSDPHPSSCAVTALSVHVAVHLSCISTSRPLNPVVSRWAALFYVLARWCRVLEGTIWKVLDCVFGKTIRHLLEGFILFQYVLQELLLQGCTFCTGLRYTHILWLIIIINNNFHIKFCAENIWSPISTNSFAIFKLPWTITFQVKPTHLPLVPPVLLGQNLSHYLMWQYWLSCGC